MPKRCYLGVDYPYMQSWRYGKIGEIDVLFPFWMLLTVMFLTSTEMIDGD